MITYQDFERAAGNDPQKKAKEVFNVINDHKNSDLYKTAVTAYAYMSGHNVTIEEREKLLVTKTGEVKADIWTPNNKTKTAIFKRFVLMETQYLLSNGIRWTKKDTEKKVGKGFEDAARNAAKLAISEAVSFGFANKDYVRIFSVREFAPLYDEENGALMAGVYFFQIDSTHPLTAIYYDINGYTKYIQRNGGIEIGATETYKRMKTTNGNGDVIGIYNGSNYETFPIVPLWGNSLHQSELVPLREKIDAYDFVQNDYINRMEDTQFYWIIRNAGGMDDNEAISQFIDQMKSLRAASVRDDIVIDPVEVHVPYQESEELLKRLERDMYKDAQMVDVENIASGAVTATQIDAAYTPLKIKADDLESCMLTWINGICDILGIDDEPTLTPAPLLNKTEEIQKTIDEYNAGLISQEYAVQRILTLNGDIDMLETVLDQLGAADLRRMTGQSEETEETEENSEESNA